MNEKYIRPENDVNRLSNQQVVLLALLVAIISAVASALVVVQIFSQNPTQTVVNTINKVTETIVETSSSSPTVVEKTFVIKEGDLVAKAVALNRNATTDIFSEAGNIGGAFVLPNNRAISLYTEGQSVSTGENTILTRHGSVEDFSLWTYDEPFNQVGTLSVKTREPLNLGETAILLTMDGGVVKGIVNQIREGEIGFSGAVPANMPGVLIDLSGTVTGFSNNSTVYTSDYILGYFEGNITNQANKQEICEDNGGNYLSSHGECENVSVDTCDLLSGSYDSCASACRHEAEPVACIAVCVPVCQI